MTVRVVALLLVFVAAACRGLDDPGARFGIFFPRYGAMDGTPLALTEGRLEVSDGCLWLVRASGMRVLPIWAGGSGLQRRDGSLQITDSAGRVVAAEGETVQMRGGEMPTDYARRLMGREEPAACGGSGFWLVGAITASSVPRSSTP
jgi:hypothetical protein